jgi:nucleoid DNA-binding protein
MNKQEFVETLAERCDFSKAEAGRALDAMLDSLTEVMVDGEEVSFPGFGKFMSQRRRAREAVNPQDPGKKIRIPAGYVAKFKPGTALREAASHAPAKAGPAASSGSTDASSSGDGSATAGSGEAAAATTPGAPPEWRPLAERG